MTPNPQRSRLLATVLAALALAMIAAGCSGSTISDAAIAESQAAEVEPDESSTADSDSTATSDSAVPESSAPAPEATTPADEATDQAAPADGTTNIVVDSTTDDYFVLYVRTDADDSAEFPVAVVLGQAGSTVLTDGRQQLAEDRYRVATHSVADPGDIDGDGIDDLTELADPIGANPLNAAEQIEFDEGVPTILDRETFEVLSYQGDDVMRDAYLAGLEYVKFYIVGSDTPTPTLYFMNTENYRAHPMFAEAIGLPGGRRPAAGSMRGDIVYNPEGVAPDGTLGTYRFAFQPNDAFPFADIALAFEMLSSGMPFLTDNLLYEPYESAALPVYEAEKDLYDDYRIPILLGG